MTNRNSKVIATKDLEIVSVRGDRASRKALILFFTAAFLLAVPLVITLRYCLPAGSDYWLMAMTNEELESGKSLFAAIAAVFDWSWNFNRGTYVSNILWACDPFNWGGYVGYRIFLALNAFFALFSISYFVFIVFCKPFLKKVAK